MGHNTNRFLTIILIFIVGLSGCQTVDEGRIRQQQSSQFYQAQQVGESEVSQVPKLDARIQCGNINLDDCGLLVTLNAVDEDIVLDVRSHVDDGISFLPNLDVLPDEGG